MILTSTVATAQVPLQEVVVSAMRQPYRGDVPVTDLAQSVQVIDQSNLTEAGITDLEGALDFASGVVRQNNFGNLWDSFAIRGFAGDENLPSIYLVNGYSAGRGFSGRRDAINIDHIEVFKGPASAMVGRSDPGGTINVVTKKPGFVAEGSVELTAGSFNQKRIAADYSRGVTQQIALRMNGAWERADSFRDTVTNRKYVLSPSVLATLGQDTTLLYELELLKQQAPFDRGVVAINNQLGQIPNSRFYGEPNDGPITIKSLGHQFTWQQSLNDQWSLLTGVGVRDSSFAGFSSDAELAENRQTLYFSNSGQLARQRRYRDYDANDWSGRIEVTGSFSVGGSRHHVLVGVDGYRYELDQLQTRFRVGTNQSNPVYGISVLNPVYGQVQSVPNATITNLLEKQTARGLYLSDHIELGAQWRLDAGLRFDGYDQTITNRANTPATQTQQSDSPISPRFGASYLLNSHVTLYANYARGFRSNSGLGANQQPFDPERSRAVELGTKLQWTSVWDATVAIYEGRKSNYLTTDPLNSGFSAALGEARSRGVELDSQLRLPYQLTWLLNYAYVDAETTRDALEVNFGRSVPAGSDLINVPKHSANTWLTQSFRWLDANWQWGVGVNHVGSRLGETGVPAFRLPAYTLVNAMLDYAVNKSLSVAVNLDNVFDRQYYPSSYARVWVAAGAPRAVTATARYRF